MVNNKICKIEAIENSAVHINKSVKDQLPEIYHLVFLNNYLKSDNIENSTSAIVYYQKLGSISYKYYLKKLTVIILSLDLVLSMIKLLAINK